MPKRIPLESKFNYLIGIDPAFEAWRALGTEWLTLQPESLISKTTSLNAFFVKYLHKMQIDKKPESIFSPEVHLPDLWSSLGLDGIGKQYARENQSNISDFLGWVLDTRINRNGVAGLKNPFPRVNVKRSGKVADITFAHAIRADDSLRDWHQLAVEWMSIQHSDVSNKRAAIDRFLVSYISGLNLERNPLLFLTKTTQKPGFEKVLIREKMRGESGAISASDEREASHVAAFVDWVLTEKLSFEDEHGNRIVPPQLHNPIQRGLRKGGAAPTESVKSPLSIRYIKELRTMLAEGPTFRDWNFAQTAFESFSHQGDWFIVDPQSIETCDPDCVWRERATTVRERSVLNLPQQVTEMWSPARAVALYIKLELPLRTFQVRMLDSGEADTWRYQEAESRGFKVSKSPLAKGTSKCPHQQGVFLKTPNQDGAVLYVNTNKTADIHKPENAKGYVIPWAHKEVLYWLERLRNWQERYNPIQEPTPWASLDHRHFGRTPPNPEFLAARGSACFLFRDASAEGEDRKKPLLNFAVDRLWYALLSCFETRCASRVETLEDGTPIRFIDPESRHVTYFPLHSLRVSLISYLILDLQLPLPVVSKLIAGHARIVMTLYYTKFGQAYMREILARAEGRVFEADQENHLRFLKDATFEAASTRLASISADGLKAALTNKSRAMFVVEDKGICPVGGGMCDIGGDVLGNQRTSSPIYSPVPGYPQERNCVRCRFFLTGPAFLPGMVAHFNALSYEAHETSERHNDFHEEVTLIENLRADCQEAGQLFTESRELERLAQRYGAEAESLGKLINDMQACNHLIGRSIQILEAEKRDGMALVAAGELQDVHTGFIETSSELHQLEVLCENAVIYPETDTRKPVLRRSQLLDCMLMANKMDPVMLKLSERQQHLVGNAVMELIQARAGSLKNALEYVEGMRRLSELGIVEDNVRTLASGIPAKELITSARSKQPLLKKIDPNAPR